MPKLATEFAFGAPAPSLGSAQFSFGAPDVNVNVAEATIEGNSGDVPMVSTIEVRPFLLSGYHLMLRFGDAVFTNKTVASWSAATQEVQTAMNHWEINRTLKMAYDEASKHVRATLQTGRGLSDVAQLMELSMAAWLEAYESASRAGTSSQAQAESTAALAARNASANASHAQGTYGKDALSLWGIMQRWNFAGFVTSEPPGAAAWEDLRRGGGTERTNIISVTHGGRQMVSSIFGREGTKSTYLWIVLKRRYLAASNTYDAYAYHFYATETAVLDPGLYKYEDFTGATQRGHYFCVGRADAPQGLLEPASRLPLLWGFGDSDEQAYKANLRAPKLRAVILPRMFGQVQF